jgi:hypothetical protein
VDIRKRYKKAGNKMGLDIVEGLTAGEYRKNNSENRSSKIEVWTILVDIISEQLAIDKNLITKNAEFIKDLGAEEKEGSVGMKKLGLILLLFLMVSLSLFSETKEEIAFNERLEKTRYPVELDFKGTPLSEILAIISKMSGITIVASTNTENMPVDLYLPKGQNLKKIIDTLKTTNGLSSKFIDDKILLYKEYTVVD